MKSTSTQTTVDTGAGNDTVDVSSDGKVGLGTVSGLLGALTVDGQGGSDTLNIGDLADAVAGSGRLSSTNFTGFGTAGIGYAGFEAVNVQLGQAADALNVVSTYLQTVTTIRAGPGSDTINVSSDLALLSDIDGHLVVDGQTGTTDTLNVSDAGDTVGQSRHPDLDRHHRSRAPPASLLEPRAAEHHARFRQRRLHVQSTRRRRRSTTGNGASTRCTSVASRPDDRPARRPRQPLCDRRRRWPERDSLTRRTDA